MRSSSLVRLGGLALLAGGAVCSAAQAVHPASPVDPFDAPLHIAYTVALLPVLLGLPAVVASQSERAGLLGLLGGVAVWLGLATTELPHAIISATVLPALLADPSTAPLVGESSVLYSNLMHGAFPVFMGLGSMLLVVGALALAVATLRAHTLPRWPAVVLLAGVVAGAALHDSPVGPSLFFCGLAGFGLSVGFGLGPEFFPRLRAGQAPSAVGS